MNALALGISNTISSSKLKYHERLANKLNNPKTSLKTYWAILKTYVNGSKIPLIPSLLVDSKLVTDSLDKANLFNKFFAKQCSPIFNDSTIPVNINFETTERLSFLEFCVHDIVKIIRSLDQNKANGHDESSIPMIKPCASSISKPLYLIFRNCLETELFPKEWKKANIFPVHKKGDKQLIINYRPVSFLPICGKVFEKIIFNSLFVYSNNNNLFNSNQSSFRPGDSCVYQLISITHDIYKAFDTSTSLEVRAVFLDLSKAFDKVRHDGLLYKLRRMGICGEYLGLIDSFLSDRFQRVLLNGQTSKWSQIKTGVPQGSLLGPLLVLVYIDDLPEGLTSNVKLFADDTLIFSMVRDSSSSSLSLNENLSKISQWGYK